MSGHTILVVEDDATFRDVVASHLATAGHNFVVAVDSLDALRRLEGGLAVDCLVADINMPAGMPHGVALANMLRQRRHDAVVLFITGFAEMANATAEMWGRNSVFIKPVDLDKLTAEIDLRLSRRSASA